MFSHADEELVFTPVLPPTDRASSMVRPTASLKRSSFEQSLTIRGGLEDGCGERTGRMWRANQVKPQVLRVRVKG